MTTLLERLPPKDVDLQGAILANGIEGEPGSTHLAQLSRT